MPKHFLFFFSALLLPLFFRSCLKKNKLSHTNPYYPQSPDYTNLTATNRAPVINSFTATAYTIDKKSQTILNVNAADPDNDTLLYSYSIISGQGILGGNSGSSETFTATNKSGSVTIQVNVSDTNGSVVSESLVISVRKSWVLVGGTLRDQNNTLKHAEIALDSQNNIYIAYYSDGSPAKFFVKKYENGAWTNVGAPVEDNGYGLDMELDKNSTPYIAYKEAHPENKITVRCYTNSSWTVVGSENSIASGDVRWDIFDLEFDHNNTPSLAFADTGSNDCVRFVQFSGGFWQQIGATLPAQTNTNSVQSVDLEFDADGTPYIAYTTNGVSVKKLNKTTTNWEFIATNNLARGSEHISGLETGAGSVDLFIDEYQLYFCMEKAAASQLCFLEYTTDSWQITGQIGFTPDSAEGPCIAFDSAGVPYVSFWDYNNQDGGWTLPGIMSYQGSSWEYLNFTSFNQTATPMYGHDTPCVISTNDIPYIVYPGNDYKIRVLAYL